MRNSAAHPKESVTQQQPCGIDYLEFSPDQQAAAGMDVAASTPHVMQPISLNTPASLIRKKTKFDAVVQGITIPIESLSITQTNFNHQPAIISSKPQTAATTTIGQLKDSKKENSSLNSSSRCRLIPAVRFDQIDWLAEQRTQRLTGQYRVLVTISSNLTCL